MSELKLISWNVNGLRAVLKKDFIESMQAHNPDILCLQETKMSDDYDEVLPDYKTIFLNAEKKGYSGVANLVKSEPLEIKYGLGIEEHDKEGRVITSEYEKFFLVNVYTPNAKRELERLEYRQNWDAEFLAYLKKLEEKKPVIACGDFNVAHKEIDLKNPKGNKKNAGFTPEEREGFDNYVKAGFIDTFRQFNQEEGQYTWWSYRFSARTKNVGWRIDYFIVSGSLKDNLKDAFILADVMGSDHCPVGITVDI